MFDIKMKPVWKNTTKKELEKEIYKEFSKAIGFVVVFGGLLFLTLVMELFWLSIIILGVLLFTGVTSIMRIESFEIQYLILQKFEELKKEAK